MRIGIVIEGGFDRSAQERVVPVLLWLVERLAREHEVHVFALNHETRSCTYPLVGAVVHDLGGRGMSPGLRVPRLFPALTRALRAQGAFDVLHGFGGGAPGALAALAGRMIGVPTIVTLAGGELQSLADIGYGMQRRWHSRLLVALSLRLATRVTAESQALVQQAERRGLRVRKTPLGVDLSRFPAAERPPEGPPWRLLHVARLSPVKDQALLLRALARVVQRLPEVHLDLVGEDLMAGAVQAEVSRLGLLRHVTFHGFQPTPVVARLCQQAHLFVLSSRHEAACVAMLEAAACGVPTVGTRVGYVADLAPEMACAVPVGDEEALADAVVALLDDAPGRVRLGGAAQSWARAHDADRTARDFAGLYQEVADRG